MPRRFYDFDARFEKDQEKEPTYRGRRYPAYTNPTQQREQSAEDVGLLFGRSFVDEGASE